VTEEAAQNEEGLVRNKRAKAAKSIPEAVPIVPESTPSVAGVQGESSAREPEKEADPSENLCQMILSPVRTSQPAGRKEAGDAPGLTTESVADTEVALRLGRQVFLPSDEKDLVGRPMGQLQKFFTGSVFRVRLV
jgi:hypothetical protein